MYKNYYRITSINAFETNEFNWNSRLLKNIWIQQNINITLECFQTKSFYLHKLSLPDEKDKPRQHVSLFVNLFFISEGIRNYSNLTANKVLIPASLSVPSSHQHTFLYVSKASVQSGDLWQSWTKSSKSHKNQGEKNRHFHIWKHIVNIIFSVKSHICYLHMQ